MLWTAIVIHGTGKRRSILRWKSSHVVFTAAWDRRRALARFEQDHPHLKVVALLAGDHADNIKCFGRGQDYPRYDFRG
jgi:hypothetical protein